MDCFTNSIKHNPNISETFYNLACLYEICGQTDNSITFYDKCLHHNPKFLMAEERKKNLLSLDDGYKNIEYNISHLSLIKI